MLLDRRSLIKTGFAGAATLGLGGLVARRSLAAPYLDRCAANAAGGYGDLKPTAARNTGEKLLRLPAGFEYTAFGETGAKMSDGHATPSAHDGMASFQFRDEIRLIRNHEVRNAPDPKHNIPGKSYDPTAGGGTTTVAVDPVTRELKRDHMSLSGTLVNCAGGPTPWGTWLSCEETCAGNDPSQVYHKDKEQGGGYAKDHGYIFEVSVLDNELKAIAPIKAMGRFVHEAIAVDPLTGIVYETEDEGTSGLYRFIPNVPSRLQEGGRLQMAAIAGKLKYDTRTGQTVGQILPVEWVDIEDPDPKTALHKPDTVYQEGLKKGGATFARLEGAWYGAGSIYVNSTNGGSAKRGQIWKYTPRGLDKGELSLLFESPGKDVLDMPDNICCSPRGGLVLCEDGDDVQFVRGLTGDGKLFDFAENILNQSEFAGANFSPDGQTLFVNIQTPGITLAIWGPWDRGAL